jgi:hypothetical protein
MIQLELDGNLSSISVSIQGNVRTKAAGWQAPFTIAPGIEIDRARSIDAGGGVASGLPAAFLVIRDRV